MSMKSGCVVYNPEGKRWCVLVESHRKDGTVRRFMSFHRSSLEASLIVKAHQDSCGDDPDVKISLFEYEFIVDDTQLAFRMMHESIEEMIEEYRKIYEEKERWNDYND